MRDKVYKLLGFLLAILTAMAFCCTYEAADPAVAEITVSSSFTPLLYLGMLLQSFDAHALWWAVIALVLGLFYGRVLLETRQNRPRPFPLLLLVFTGLLFGALNVMALCVVRSDSLDFIFANPYQVLVFLLCVLGWAALFILAALAFFKLLRYIYIYFAPSARIQALIRPGSRLFRPAPVRLFFSGHAPVLVALPDRFLPRNR